MAVRLSYYYKNVAERIGEESDRFLSKVYYEIDQLEEVTTTGHDKKVDIQLSRVPHANPSQTCQTSGPDSETS